MSYLYEYAGEQDGEEIARLLEDVELKGEISLAYCRRPNAVLSMAKEGDHSAIVMAKDETGKIIGVGGCIIRGDVAYLTGLRAVKKANIIQSYELLRRFCAEHGVKLTYTTILKENRAVQVMLEKKRSRMPHYLRHSECTVHIIRKNLRLKDKNQLILVEQVYILRNREGEEIARGEAVEQWDYKQYVIKQYGFKLRLAKRFLSWMPEENQVLKFFTLRGVKAKDERALESFLRHVSHLPLEGSFFLYGGNTCPVHSLKYESLVYLVDWDKKISDPSAIPLDIEIADL